MAQCLVVPAPPGHGDGPYVQMNVHKIEQVCVYVYVDNMYVDVDVILHVHINKYACIHSYIT